MMAEGRGFLEGADPRPAASGCGERDTLFRVRWKRPGWVQAQEVSGRGETWPWDSGRPPVRSAQRAAGARCSPGSLSWGWDGVLGAESQPHPAPQGQKGPGPPTPLVAAPGPALSGHPGVVSLSLAGPVASAALCPGGPPLSSTQLAICLGLKGPLPSSPLSGGPWTGLSLGRERVWRVRAGHLSHLCLPPGKRGGL